MRAVHYLNDLRRFWIAYRQNKAAVIGLIILGFFCAIGLVAPLIALHPTKVGVGDVFQKPNWEFPMGTDNLGRDVFAGVVSGVSISLTVGFTAVAARAIIGIFVGSISGYFGGRIDLVLMRITEIFQVIPSFFLALVIVTFIGGSIWNVVLVLAIVGWPRLARLVRGQFLSIKEKEFVEAAKAIGETKSYIIFNEILVNALPPVIVSMSLGVGRAILVEASLSFLGLGDPTTMSWGYMIRNAHGYLRTAWWMAFFPGLCIFLLVTAMNLIGDGLNDVLNPRLRGG